MKAVDGRPGRDTTDPRLLVSLWVDATSKKSCRESKEARASTTDPDARVMKMAVTSVLSLILASPLCVGIETVES